MGKGDRKTAKGKRNISSYGNSRTNTPAKVVAKAAVVAKPKAAAAPARKVAVKKAAK
jgi:30S ribosomal protein S31